MGIPCEECIVYALCRAKYSEIVEATIECEVLWNYIVEETHSDKVGMAWFKSKERQERIKRMENLKKFFPNCTNLEWMGDQL